MGITDGRVYQLIRDGLIQPVSDDALTALGRNPRYVQKPRWWIADSVIEEFLSRERRTSKSYTDHVAHVLQATQ